MWFALRRSKAHFTREVKLLRALQSEYIVSFLDAFDEEQGLPTIVLEGGTSSLSEMLSGGQLTQVERKWGCTLPSHAPSHHRAPTPPRRALGRYVLERLCLAVDFVHSKGFVLVDLKPHNVVIFGSLLGLRLIDLECLRKKYDSSEGERGRGQGGQGGEEGARGEPCGLRSWASAPCAAACCTRLPRTPPSPLAPPTPAARAHRALSSSCR